MGGRNSADSWFIIKSFPRNCKKSVLLLNYELKVKLEDILCGYFPAWRKMEVRESSKVLGKSVRYFPKSHLKCKWQLLFYKSGYIGLFNIVHCNAKTKYF